jgi:hypothetical protein
LFESFVPRKALFKATLDPQDELQSPFGHHPPARQMSIRISGPSTRNSFSKCPLYCNYRTIFELRLFKHVARNNTSPHQIGLSVFKLTDGRDFLPTQCTITYRRENAGSGPRQQNDKDIVTEAVDLQIVVDAPNEE